MMAKMPSDKVAAPRLPGISPDGGARNDIAERVRYFSCDRNRITVVGYILHFPPG